MPFVKAVRTRVPLLISISSVSGGGKTYSALLLAAGLAGPHGRVGMLDVENSRGLLYADSPGIMAALPNGYEYSRLDPPFSPDRYIAAITEAEAAGITVLVIDSVSHEYEGIGGVQEIAEKNPLGRMPNWAKAKMAHKRFVNHCLSSSMDLIFCCRARERVKIFKRGEAMLINAASPGDGDPLIAEKDTIVQLGIQGIQEKGFIFEMLLSTMLDERTHHALPIKVPEPLLPLFPGKRVITKSDGDAIRQWNETGAVSDPLEQVQKRARAAAEDGMESYRQFWGRISASDRKRLAVEHEDNKRIAEQADTDRKAAESADDSAESPSEKITIHTPPTDAPEPPTDAPPESAPVEPSEPPPAPPEAAEAQETANGNGSELPDAHIINEADKIESETGNRPSLEDLRAQLAATRAHPKGRRK